MVKRVGSLSTALSKYKDMNASVRVGVLENATYPDGTPVAMVAFWSEYGATANIPSHTRTINRSINEKTGNYNKGGRFVKASKSNFETTVTIPAHTVVIPPRPFFRTTVSEQKKNWVLSVQNLMKQNSNPQQVMGLIGESMKGNIVQGVVSFSDPKNADSTERAKGFNNPLIDKGIMMRSISFEVDEGD